MAVDVCVDADVCEIARVSAAAAWGLDVDDGTVVAAAGVIVDRLAEKRTPASLPSIISLFVI